MRNFDDMYMEMAHVVSQQSRAKRAQVGALLVKDNNVLSFGFNGTPSGFDNLCETEEYTTKPEVLHAESNALMKIARSTQSSEGSTLYVTLSPCFECAKLIVQAGVKRVVFGAQYRDDSSITFLKQANIEVEQNESR
jgi:dCMP deaminase